MQNSCCNGNDDRSKFLSNNKATNLLYWWQKLDEYDIVSFTCNHLPEHLTADSTTATDVSTLSYRRSPTQEAALSLARNIQLVGNSMSELVDCQTQE